MEYGYTLLRHVVRQVFGNLRAAAQLTVVPLFAPQLLIVLAGFNLGAVSPADETMGGGRALLALGLVMLLAVGFCWAAVAWHRFVLREEWPRGVLPPLNWGRILGYLGRALLIVLIVAAIALAVGLAVSLVLAVTGSGVIAQLMSFGLVFGAAWLWTRYALVLPARSVDRTLSIGESWKVTSAVSGEIFLPILVFSILGSIVPGFVVLALGATLLTELVVAVISWVFLLLNLALLTTLYGNLVEGREIG